jgi:hypothetical protein
MQTLDTQPTPKVESIPSPKKTYRSPSLCRYGNVNEVTETNTTFTQNSDAGSFPNVYAS